MNQLCNSKNDKADFREFARHEFKKIINLKQNESFSNLLLNPIVQFLRNKNDVSIKKINK